MINLPRDATFLREESELFRTEKTLAPFHLEEPEPPYLFRGSPEENLNDSSPYPEELQLLDCSFLDEDLSLPRQLGEFNVWDATDPRSMKPRPLRKLARILREKQPQKIYSADEKIEALRLALRPDTILSLEEFQVIGKPVQKNEKFSNSLEQKNLRYIRLIDRNIMKPFFAPDETNRKRIEGLLTKKQKLLPENLDENLEEAKSFKEDFDEDDQEFSVKFYSKYSNSNFSNPFKKMKISDLKNRIFSVIEADRGDSGPKMLSKVFESVVQSEPETQGLKVQSIFLMILHIASEKGFRLVEKKGDIEIWSSKGSSQDLNNS